MAPYIGVGKNIAHICCGAAKFFFEIKGGQGYPGGNNPTSLTLRGAIFQAKGGVQSRTTKAKGGLSPPLPPMDMYVTT